MNDHLIEDYLDGKLDEAERAAFEKRLAKEGDLQTELILHEDIRKMVQAEEELRLKKLMVGRQKKTKLIGQRWFAMAAVFLLLILATFFLSRQFQSEDIVTAYFEPYPNVTIPVERNRPDNALLNRALVNYQRRNFEQAALQMDSLLQEGFTEDSDISFYYGNALMAQTEYAKAIPIFREISEKESAFFQVHAVWYLGLALWEENRKEEAATLFEIIKNSEGHPFQEKAMEVLMEVK